MKFREIQKISRTTNFNSLVPIWRNLFAHLFPAEKNSNFYLVFFFSRINLWHMEITDQSFNIVDIKPANMEELTEVITASEFHPKECNHFVYSSSKGTIRLCDMRQAALCDTHAKRKCCSIYSADTVGHNSSGQKKNSWNEKIQFDGYF